MPHHINALFIIPCPAPHQKPDVTFPLSIFASDMHVFRNAENPSLTYSKLRLRLSPTSLAKEDFALLSVKFLNYLRSYRQPVNGWTSPKALTYHTLLTNLFYEVIYMTTKPRTPNRPKGQPELEFLDVTLSDADFEALDTAKISASQLVANLVAAVESGFRFSYSYKPETKKANAMFTDTRVGSPTKDKAVSAFSDNCADAMRILLYKHVVVLEGDWSRVNQTQRPRRTRG